MDTDSRPTQEEVGPAQGEQGPEQGGEVPGEENQQQAADAGLRRSGRTRKAPERYGGSQPMQGTSKVRLSPRARKRAQADAKFKKKEEPLRTVMAIKERWILEMGGN